MRPVTAAQRLVRAVALVVAATAWFTPPPAFAAGDFTLLVSPASQLLPPGGAVAYSVEVGAIGGFADPVQLSVGSLPAGVTSALSETTVTPPATVSLTLSATEDAALGDFSLIVTGTSGGLTHTTSGSATVNFGLVPICNGHIRGTVTDRESGEPIGGARVNGELTDAAGHWGPVDVSLGENNSPVPVFALASKDGYFNSFVFTDPVVCGQTTVVDLTLLRWHPAVITGHVVLGVPDPADPDRTVVDPAGGPLEGATASVSVAQFVGASDVSAADGSFRLDLPFVGQNNTPQFLAVMADRDGYWPPNRTGSVDAGEVHAGDTVDIVIPMVPVCTGSISAVVRLADTNALATGVTVTAISGTDRKEAVTDAVGRVEFPALRLGYNNQATDYSLITDAPDDYHTGGAETSLTGCDDHQAVEILLDPDAFGSIEGFVHDENTGDPVAGVNVGFSCAPCDFSDAMTDDAGHYRISHVPADPPSSWFVHAVHLDYWPVADTVAVDPGETTRLDFVVLRVRHASVSGVVRDSVTGDPLPDAGVAGGGANLQVDANGRYAFDNLSLGDRNSPADASLSAGSPGYWFQTKSIHYSADEAVVLDFELLKVCDGATIRGHVVDFVTGLPIEGAQVSTTGAFDLTDADGTFVLSNVPVGTNNSPSEVTVGVSKTGYFSQSKRVTVFCGAHFQLDFAPPTPTSSLEGTVSNAVTGDPIEGVTVIGEWGGQTRTDADGDYDFNTVPLQADGSDHAWDVSALTDDCGQATKTFTAHADTTARVDFAFCRDEEDHPAISLAKSGSFTAGANSLADPGETIAYSLVVANTGDVDVHGVAVTDAKVGTVTCPATTIPDGGSITCTGSYAINQQDIDAGSVHNTASADSDETGETESSTTVTLPVRAALHLDKLADHQSFAAAGVVIGYTFTLTNQGNVTLGGPFAVADDQATNEACPATPATLAPGASITCTASDITTQQDLNSGALVNTATARATFGSATVTSNQATATVTATQSPALTLVKTANPTTFAAAGQVIAYTYVATNSGNVALTAPYGVADDRSTDEHCPATPATLAPGASVTCSATYTVTTGDVAAGSVTNRATATARFGAQTVTSNEATATVTWTQPGAQLLPTQTTCQMYRAGATSLTEALYNPQKGKIGSVAPGVMFFYDTITLPAGSAPVTLSVTQARSPSLSGWTPIPVQDTGQIVLYDQATCLKSKAQGTTSYVAGTGTATVRVTAAGTYILGIKYNLSSLAGIAVGNPPPTITYTFGRTGGATTASIAIRPKK